MINRLAVIGLGLIGGSLALALRQQGLVKQVVGYARSEQTREQALSLGIVDQVATSIEATIEQADIVLLAVPMGAMVSTLSAIAPHMTDSMIVTDAGSAKGQVVEDAQTALGQRINQFVPGHPIAGTEKSGPSAAFPELYQNHRVILTPIEQTNTDAVQTVKAMWSAAGAEVLEMPVQHHDRILAATSHLPHLLAFNLVGLLAQSDDVDEVLRYAAGGFRDFSRIASSDPVMWRDICLTNRDAILALLQQYQQQLTDIEHAIANQDGQYLENLFAKAKQARDTRFNDPSLVDNSEV